MKKSSLREELLKLLEVYNHYNDNPASPSDFDTTSSTVTTATDISQTVSQTDIHIDLANDSANDPIYVASENLDELNTQEDNFETVSFTKSKTTKDANNSSSVKENVSHDVSDTKCTDSATKRLVIDLAVNCVT